MIIEFSVQNFGSIKEKQTLSFEATKSKKLEDDYVIQTENGLRLLKVAMIYGANASGKTTILKALDFLRDLVINPVDKKSDELEFEPFLFDKDTPKENSHISIDFLEQNIHYSYSLEFNKYAIINEKLDIINIKRVNVYKRTTSLDKQLSEIKLGDKIKKDKTLYNVLKANTLWNNTVLGGYLKTNLENIEMKSVQDWFNIYLKRVILPNTNLSEYVTQMISNSQIIKESIVKILKKADFQISDIFINEVEKEIPDGLIDFLKIQIKASNETFDELKKSGKFNSKNIEMEHIVNENKYTLPFNEESHGTRRYFGFAGILALLIKKPIFFPIDELETSLHPDLYIHFLLSFLHNAKKSQLLFTTHNREMLNNKDLFRNDVIWFTEKDNDCGTQLYSLADFDSSVVRDTSNVYNAYKIGKLGGVPNLGDYYIDINEEN